MRWLNMAAALFIPVAFFRCVGHEIMWHDCCATTKNSFFVMVQAGHSHATIWTRRFILVTGNFFKNNQSLSDSWRRSLPRLVMLYVVTTPSVWRHKGSFRVGDEGAVEAASPVTCICIKHRSKVASNRAIFDYKVELVRWMIVTSE